MQPVKQWLELKPVDTLFFRGSDPLVAGEGASVASLFPPMPSTITGALVTTILRQRNIPPEVFLASDEGTSSIASEYPFLGSPQKPGFRIVGPLMSASVGGGVRMVLYPVPATWFAGEMPLREEKGVVPLIVQKAGLLDEGIVNRFNLRGSVRQALFVTAPNETGMKSLSGNYANEAALQESQGKDRFEVHLCGRLENAVHDRPCIIQPAALWSRERRVGIELEPHARRTKTGQLYSADHVRMHRGVSLMVGLSEDLCPTHLDYEGLMQLGGERRLVTYMVIKEPMHIYEGSSEWMMALAHVPVRCLAEIGMDNLPRASTKAFKAGGWDMKKRFHKPTVQYLPPGTAIMVGSGSVPFGFMRI